MLLVEGAEVYTPSPRGRQSILIAGGRIEALLPFSPPGGENVPKADEAHVERVDASGLIALPGLIDVHTHLIGGSGEKGFASQTQEFFAPELLQAGITTVVGTLGTDTTTKSLRSLLARVKGLRESGMAAWMWTGGYDVPPKSITGSARDDIILIEEVIGIGETAISDRRSMHPTAHELARLATDAYVAGTLTKKAGVLHLHVGDGKTRLKVLREVLENYDVEPSTLYPTHVERNEELMAEALELGTPIDLDVVERDLVRWMRFCRERGADLRNITASSDAAITPASALFEQVRDCVRENVLSIEEAFALVTRNPARILKLTDSGELEPGRRGDVLLLDPESLEIRHVICGGKDRSNDPWPRRKK